MEETSIYIHIPYCAQKCAYCAFSSFVDCNIDQYIDALCNEMKKRKTDKLVKTIYIGGGTPSILSLPQLEKIVECLKENFNLKPYCEFTIEANPNSLDLQKLKSYKSLGINRLSIGVQSLRDKSLKKIGRLHTAKEALSKVALARKFFDNVSCDLIVGLEGETGKDLCGYAKKLLDLGVKHISCYLLEVYSNTPLGKMVTNKKYLLLDDAQTIEAFEKLCKYLIDAGFCRYEISNFALEGYESQHNLNYWSRGEYIGLGLSAHSFENEIRTQNANNFEDYFAGKTAFEKLTQKEQNEEKIMLGLRCNLGVDIKSLQGYDIKNNPYYADYIKQGILLQKENIITLNPLFYHLSNTIIANLMT